VDLVAAFDRAAESLVRLRSGDADPDAVAEALDGLLRAVAGGDPELADRYDRVFGGTE
jgi:hypothetical protein